MTGRISGWGLPFVCASLLCGCTAVVDGTFVGKSKPNEVGAGGSAASGGSGGASMVETAACAPPVARRLVQLTELQYVSSLRALFGDSAVKLDGAPQAETKPFTSLGVVPTTASLNTQLNWSEQAVTTLSGKELATSGCDADASDACAEKFLRSFTAPLFAAFLLLE